MEEFTVRLGSQEYTITCLGWSNYIVSYTICIRHVLVPHVIGTIYCREDVARGIKWYSDSINEELVEQLGNIIEDINL